MKNILKINYTSYWDGGIAVTTSAKLNLKTGEVFDIADSNVEGIDIFEGESITFWKDGSEYELELDERKLLPEEMEKLNSIFK